MNDMKSRIMYIEFKGHEVTGPARIGRVTFSKTGKTLYYAGKQFQRLTPCGYLPCIFGRPSPKSSCPQEQRSRIVMRDISLVYIILSR